MSDEIKRYEVCQHQHVYMIKDHQEKEWVATCSRQPHAQKIAFLLNEFERTKGPIQPKQIENESNGSL